jgi:hypothetical protein
VLVDKRQPGPVVDGSPADRAPERRLRKHR